MPDIDSNNTNNNIAVGLRAEPRLRRSLAPSRLVACPDRKSRALHDNKTSCPLFMARAMR